MDKYFWKSECRLHNNTLLLPEQSIIPEQSISLGISKFKKAPRVFSRSMWSWNCFREKNLLKNPQSLGSSFCCSLWRLEGFKEATHLFVGNNCYSSCSVQQIGDSLGGHQKDQEASYPGVADQMLPNLSDAVPTSPLILQGSISVLPSIFLFFLSPSCFQIQEEKGEVVKATRQIWVPSTDLLLEKTA